MASLKEVKARIASVNSTLKITSAMKMVASAKLHRAQAAIENMLPYERKLNEHTRRASFRPRASVALGLCRETRRGSSAWPWWPCRRTRRSAARSTPMSLKKLDETLDRLPVARQTREHSDLPDREENCRSGPQGRAIDPQGRLPVDGRETDLPGSVRTGRAVDERCIAKREIDRVELIYNHFKSTAVTGADVAKSTCRSTGRARSKAKGLSADYIVEPDRARTVVQTLVPQVLSLKIFTDAARFERRRARRPDDRDADGDRQCDRAVPGTDDPVQQVAPADDYQRTARYDGKPKSATTDLSTSHT